MIPFVMGRVAFRMGQITTQAGFWVLHKVWEKHKRTNKRPWYIVVERSNIPEYNDIQWEDVVIGPFGDEKNCYDHMCNSMDVEDWCYGEAKAKQYNVDDVYMTQDPEIPSYGVNIPVRDES